MMLMIAIIVQILSTESINWLTFAASLSNREQVTTTTTTAAAAGKSFSGGVGRKRERGRDSEDYHPMMIISLNFHFPIVWT